MSPIFCKCGCGQETKIGKKSGSPNIYIHGHHGKDFSKETRKILSDKNSGENNPSYGKPTWNKGLTSKTDERILVGEKHSLFGKHPTNETKRKMSIARMGKFGGNKHPMYGVHRFGEESPNWKGGKKLAIIRANTKRRDLFRFIPLNDCSIDGWVGHHLDLEYVIFIPEKLHISTYHSVTKGINMNIINDKVYEWFIDYYFKGV